MKRGKIKLFDKTRGFGFITKDDDGKDVYFNVADVAKGRELKPGDAVTFELEKTPKGAKAVKVAKAE
jgi:CspA family cold shock protein